MTLIKKILISGYVEKIPIDQMNTVHDNNHQESASVSDARAMRQLDETSLHTLMCKVEFIINSKPLSNVSPDHLTPNHILTLKSTITLPPVEFQRADVYQKKRWRCVRLVLLIPIEDENDD